MHLRRLAIALTSAAALTAAGAPAARADIGFVVMPDFSSVETDGEGRLELVRGGAVIATSDEGAVTVDELKPGDVARAFYDDGTPAGSATYDGTPVIAGACIGSASFTVTRGTATLQFAGAFTDSAFEPLVGTWDEAQLVRVSLSRALVDGDTAFAAVGRDDVDPPFSSMRMQPAVACSTAPGPGGTSPKPGQPGATPKLMRLAAALRLSGAALTRARLRARIALPVRLPERGRIALHVRAKGRTLARGNTSTSQVTLKVTAAGRRRLRRGAKVTLDATFRPARAGAKPQRASVKVTLRGSWSRAPGAA